MTSRALVPSVRARQGTGPDAAGWADLQSAPRRADAERSAADEWVRSGVGGSGRGGGSGAELTPAALTCGPDCPHPDRCAFEHAALMDRLTTYA